MPGSTCLLSGAWTAKRVYETPRCKDFCLRIFGGSISSGPDGAERSVRKHSGGGKSDEEALPLGRLLRDRASVAGA